jgi:hypothetical protein
LTPLTVDISATLNLQTGVLTWTFRSIHLATGVELIGVFNGLLPMDDATGRSQGRVTYTIQPKANLATETVVSAPASVVCDTRR